METQTIEPQRGNRTAGPASVVIYAGAAAFAPAWLGRHRLPARTGSSLVGAGAFPWIAGNILQLRGYRAVGLMATHANPIQTTNSIAFTIDAISQAFALAAAARRHGHRRWVSYTIVVALTVLATSGCYAAGNDNLRDLAVLASGTVLLPAWLIWASRIDRTGRPSPHAP